MKELEELIEMLETCLTIVIIAVTGCGVALLFAAAHWLLEMMAG